MAYAIIIGGGKIGYYLARSLINRDYEVCLMEKDAGAVRRLAADLGDVVMQGDGCDPLVLKSAGVARADLVFAATGDDPDNLVICQIAQNYFGNARVVARVNNPDDETLFERLGIRDRINGTTAVLNLIGQKVGHSPIILLGALEKSSLDIVELIIEDESPLNGAKLAELNFPGESLVISVLRNGNAMIPTGHTVFQSGDVLLVLIPSALESTLREFLV